MWAQLGGILLEGLRGFSSYSLTQETEHAEHALIEGKPRLQFIARKLDQISASMYLHAGFINAQEIFIKLDEYRNLGTVLPLIAGNGELIGNFVLLVSKKNPETTDVNGGWISGIVELELREYSTPQLAQQGAAHGFASTSQSPVEVTPPPIQLESLTSIAAKTVTDSGTGTAQITQQIELARLDPAFAKTTAVNVGVSVNGLVSTLELMQSTIDNAPASGALYLGTRDLSAFIPSMVDQCGLISDAALSLSGNVDLDNPTGITNDINSLVAMSTELNTMSRTLRTLSTQLITLFIIRK